ncbi:B12-binding domain-containing radical SAM protein [bacterium]|nr:B12-binding domain-containing radical SAM protein [bacterium]
MRVFLVDAPHKIWPALRGWVPNPGLLAIGAYIENDFEVKVLDGTVLERTWFGLEEIIKRAKPEVVGITTISTCFIIDTFNACRLIKEVSPKTTIVAGGTHPSLVPEETLRLCPEIDYIVVSEGEITFHEFLKTFERGERDFSGIKGLAYLDGDKFVYNGDRALIEDLDSLPLPAYHLFDMYHPLYHMASEGKDTLHATFSRGCSHRCTFCSETALWKHRRRGMSPKKMVDIFQHLNEKYGRKTFLIGDDIFNYDRQVTKEFCEEMIRRKIKVNYWFQSRADYILRDKDLLPLLKKAGCFQILIGIEHYSQKALDSYHKGTTIEQNLEALKAARKEGLFIVGAMMMGWWEDGEEGIRSLDRFCRPYVSHFGLGMLTPIPGTPFYNEAKRLGRIEEKDYSKYDLLHPIMPTKYMTREELANLQLNMHRHYYFIPWFLWQTFFHPLPVVRKVHKHILRYAWDVFKQEVFGAKGWVQPGYITFEDYRQDRK